VPHIFTIRLLVRSALISAVTQLHAQHYPTGVQGIKAGSLPGPGFTVEDDNSFYFADRLPGFNGTFDYRDSGFSTFSYVQAPRLTWMSSWKMLGANYGAAIRVPVEFKETKFIVEPLTGPVHLKSDQFGLADIEVQPVLLAWHLKHFDFSTGYSFWAPTGDYDQNRFFAENIGDGYWTHSFMLGVTWYPDSDKTWAISVLNHYDINTRQYSTLEYVPPTQSNPLGIGSFDLGLRSSDPLQPRLSPYGPSALVSEVLSPRLCRNRDLANGRGKLYLIVQRQPAPGRPRARTPCANLNEINICLKLESLIPA